MSRAPSSLPELLADESDADVASLLPDQTATDLAPLGADATGEIDAVDIIEVSPPSLPPSRAVYPSSIAPIALDVTPPRVSLASLPSWVPTPTSTQQLARAAGIPAFSARAAVIATSVIGMCLIAGTVGAVLGYSRVSAREPTAATGQPVVHAPRIAVVLGAREEITEAPLTAPAKAPPPGAAGPVRPPRHGPMRQHHVLRPVF